GWQEFNVNATGSIQEHCDLLARMSLQPIPDDEDRALEMLHALSQEGDKVCCLDVRIRIERKVKSYTVRDRRNGEAGDDRYLLPTPRALFENGRLTAGRPGTAYERSHQKAGLIDEN